jgi:hypothetical protein
MCELMEWRNEGKKYEEKRNMRRREIVIREMKREERERESIPAAPPDRVAR